MYEVLLEKQAERDLRKLPADLFDRSVTATDVIRVVEKIGFVLTLTKLENKAEKDRTDGNNPNLANSLDNY